jgi:hypothetical protein
MNTSTAGIFMLLIVAAVTSSAAHAQQSTERYIPISESPGISGSESIIGTITEVDRATYEMTVRGPDWEKTVRMTGATRYYLDRTKVKRSNQTTRLENCKVGQRVEIKLDADGTADWVKIEAQ